MGCTLSRFLCNTNNYYDDIEDNSCNSCSNIINTNNQKIMSNNNISIKNKCLMQNIVKNPLSIHDVYFMDSSESRILGEGQNGYVKIVIHKKTLRQFALKTLNKNISLCEDVKNEIEIMSSIDHPNILKLYEYFETDDCVYLVLHLCQAGDLFELVCNSGRLNEKLAAKITFQILTAIKYLHHRKIVHRDLKLENFLLDSNDGNNCEIKLTDFGYSRHLDELVRLRDSVGTIFYAAPEVNFIIIIIIIIIILLLLLLFINIIRFSIKEE